MRPVFSLLPLSLVVAVASAIATVRAPADPGAPTLPDTPYEYEDVPLPDHVRAPARRADNTPRENPITNEGAALGRVLFYDVRLSANETVSCGSCHRQEHGFSAPEPLSLGLHGELTARHSMALANARYYAPGRFDTLREVVEFYNEDVRPSRRLDRALMHAAMHGLGLTATEVDAIVAFLGTLTDEAFLTDPRFSDPFAP